MGYHGTAGSFAVCLTHDVDRPYKTYQSIYDAYRRRSLGPLRSLSAGGNPYWQFEDIMALEDRLGVRSAFYFLNERHLLETSPRNWLSPTSWIQHLGGYDVTADEVASIIRDLERGDWEVGLHGSYHSADDPDRLEVEKTTLEDVLNGRVRGGRQHYLRLDGFDTWRHHQWLGLDYDSSLGHSSEYGFSFGYGLVRPFGDDFVVFPVTIMDQALPDPGARFEEAWRACERVLEEAAEHGAIMTVLWHVRLFNETDFPGYRRLYRRLVERAIELGAWIGTPGELYDTMGVGRATDAVPIGGATAGEAPATPSAPRAVQGGTD